MSGEDGKESPTFYTPPRYTASSLHIPPWQDTSKLWRGGDPFGRPSASTPTSTPSAVAKPPATAGRPSTSPEDSDHEVGDIHELPELGPNGKKEDGKKGFWTIPLTFLVMAGWEDCEDGWYDREDGWYGCLNSPPVRPTQESPNKASTSTFSPEAPAGGKRGTQIFFSYNKVVPQCVFFKEL